MGHPGLLCCDQLPVAYNYHILTQKHTAAAINREKLSQAHTGNIGFKGCKNSRHINALSGLKG